jgi:SAM-dependent methyltransferase
MRLSEIQQIAQAAEKVGEAAIKAILPKPLVEAIGNYRTKKVLEEYRSLSTQEAFTRIYEKGLWGKSGDSLQPFFSGLGSHDQTIVSTYIKSVQVFLSTFAEKPNVVDLGCGDFFVGSKIRPLCGNYIACDIVPKLIEFNKEKYKALSVDFRVLDLTSDELPNGDIVIVRQVLQHLSNEQILCGLPKISSKYKYLILTEHLPAVKDFEHNLDKPAGPDIRASIASGIVLTSPPFNLKPKSERELCQADAAGEIIPTIIQTTLYQLA